MWIDSSAIARGTVPRGRAACRRSISMSVAGNTVNIATKAIRIALPEMNPSS
jgi:hypothetical protein